MSKLDIPRAARPAWETLGRALCDYEPPCSHDPEAWFSYDPADAETAVAGCHRCRVAGPCGDYADAARERHGTWAAIDRDPRRWTDRPESETSCHA